MPTSSHYDSGVPRVTNARELMEVLNEIRAMVPNESVNRLYDLLTAVADYSERDMRAQRDALYARLNSVMDICDEAERAGITSGGPFTVRRVHDAALGDDARRTGGAR